MRPCILIHYPRNRTELFMNHIGFHGDFLEKVFRLTEGHYTWISAKERKGMGFKRKKNL